MLKILQLITVLYATLTLASATSPDPQKKWAKFKAEHGKKYSGKEDNRRRSIYEKHLKIIQEHNKRYAKGETSFYMAENRFADWTTEEFTSRMNGFRLEEPIQLPKLEQRSPAADVSGLPGTVNWTGKGYVTGVKDQGQCGSCWAFSTTGSVEGQHFNATGRLVSLSESNLVDCSRPWGNNGCEGGWMTQAFQYILDNKGIDNEDSYSYRPRDCPCNFTTAGVGATISSYANVTQGDENALQLAVATVGPVSVAIDASSTKFMFYHGGVFDEPNCSSTRLDHGVLVVGYGVTNGSSGVQYWLVKNSWGTGWGIHGYIMMSRNKNNQCGIASMASYPVINN